MRFARITVLIALVVLLSSCATTRTKDLSAEIFNDPAKASVTIQPLVNVPYAHFVNLRIDDDLSPSLRRSDNGQNYFEVVGLEGKKDQPFHLAIYAICDCLGFSKTSILPDGLLYDAQGHLIARSTRSAKDPRMTELRGTFTETGSYHLLVIADSTHEDEKIGKVLDYTTLFTTLFPPSIKISTEGKAQVAWIKEQTE